MYQAIPKDDTYKDLFSSVVSIHKTFHQKGLFLWNLSEKNIKTNFSSSKKILETAVNLICEGYDAAIFDFIIELEFNKAISQNTPVSEQELCELTLAKILVHHIRDNRPDSIYDLLNYTCDYTVRNELVPTADWVDTPI